MHQNSRLSLCSRWPHSQQIVGLIVCRSLHSLLCSPGFLQSDGWTLTGWSAMERLALVFGPLLCFLEKLLQLLNRRRKRHLQDGIQTLLETRKCLVGCELMQKQLRYLIQVERRRVGLYVSKFHLWICEQLKLCLI